MRKFVTTMAVLVAFAFAVPQPAQAQEVHVAPQVSLAEEADLGVGGRALVNLTGMEGFEVAGSFDYFFPGGNADYWEINGNLHYNIQAGESEVFFPYVGGGLNFANSSSGVGSTNDTGFNLVGGAKFQAAERFIPYAELRLGTAFTGQLVVTGGLLF